MKILIILNIFFILLIDCLFAQSIVIPDGASIYIPSGADICAVAYGNITGNIYGEGTQCNQSPVPVELILFTAKVKDEYITLEWTTATEVSNYGFEVERASANNKPGQEDWKKIGFVEGHGNSNSPKQYSYTDENPVGGSKFKYRLKQIDTDGKFEYSDIIEAELIPGELVLYQNYPNPFNPSTTIKFSVPATEFISIKLYDVIGNEVATLLNEQRAPGFYEVRFEAGSLASGVYIYKLQAGSFTQAKKLILMK